MVSESVQPRSFAENDAAVCVIDKAISNTLNKLRVGTTVKIRYYDIDAYTNIEGVVTEINPPYLRLKVVKTAIPFDDIYTIELLGKNVIFQFYYCWPPTGRLGYYTEIFI